MIGIYKITNLINGKCYIGQSVHINARWNKHKTTAFNINAHTYEYPLYRAIRKYGLENFSFEVLEECSSEELGKKESFWIKHFNSNNKNFGYNQTSSTDVSYHFMKLDQEKLNEIVDKLINTRILLKDIAAEYEVSIITIKDINHGYSWHNDSLNYPLRKSLKEIRKIKDNTKKEKLSKTVRQKAYTYCIDCGKEISRDATRCVDCCKITQRVADRPSKEELKNLIRTKPFTQIGKQFGVSDNTIRKWCDYYNLPRKVTEIKKISDEDWSNL